MLKTLGYNILIPAPKDEEINKIDENSEYTVTLTKKSKKRSLNANAYAWVLCEKIARELSKNAYISKKWTCISALFKKAGHLYIFYQ